MRFTLVLTILVLFVMLVVCLMVVLVLFVPCELVNDGDLLLLLESVLHLRGLDTVRVTKF